MDTLAIIKRIELRLAELRMSKAEFYLKSGISSASYSQWNTGRYKPSKTKIESAATALNTTVDYLLGIENAPTSRGERNIDMTEVDFAFYGNYKELTEDQQQTIRDMVRIMRERRSNTGEK